MKKSFHNVVSFGLLTVLLFSLVVALTGCGFFNQEPEAKISSNPSPEDGTVSVEVGTKVSFDAGNSEDPDGSIASYDWDFGDGKTDEGETVNHSYDSEGPYTVTLTVTDDDGAEDTDSVKVEVETSGPEPPPPPSG